MGVTIDRWKASTEMVNKILEDHRDVADILDMTLEAIRGQILAAQSADKSAEKTMLAHLWRSAYEYQEDALFLFLTRRFDAAFGLMRMASELARDIARMSEKSEHFTMWMNKRENRHKKEYKRAFKFRMDDKIEKYVYSQYKLFSEIGTHGHLTSTFSMEVKGKTDCGEFVKLEVNEEAVIERTGIWGLASISVHLICGRVFDEEIRNSGLSENSQEFFIHAGNVFQQLAKKENWECYCDDAD